MTAKITAVIAVFVLLFVSAHFHPSSFEHNRVLAQTAGHCEIEIRDRTYNVLVPRTNQREFTFSYELELIKISYYIDPTYSSNQHRVRYDFPNFTDTNLYGEFKGSEGRTNGLVRYEADYDFDYLRRTLASQIIRNPDTSLRVPVYLQQRNSNNSDWITTCGPPIAITLDRTGSCSVARISSSRSQVTVTLNYNDFLINQDYKLSFSNDSNQFSDQTFKVQNQTGELNLTVPHQALPNDGYQFSIKRNDDGRALCGGTFSIPGEGIIENESPTQPNTESQPYKICNQLKEGVAGKEGPREICHRCYKDHNGIWTAVGCISTDPAEGIGQIIKIAVGLAGGVALLMILAAAFTLSTSQGDPKKVGDAKEMLTAAIIGLLFVVFSVTILQLIGVTILQIPGFGQ